MKNNIKNMLILGSVAVLAIVLSVFISSRIGKR